METEKNSPELPNPVIPENITPPTSETVSEIRAESPPEEKPVNEKAIEVAPEEIIEKRGRGRPKGSGKKKTEGTPEAQSLIVEASGAMPSEPSEIGTGSLAPEGTPEGTPEAPAKPPTDYQQLGEITVAMGTSTLAMIFGPEWQPEDDNERNQLVLALSKYMEAKQVEDIPPGALLGIVLLTYSAKRLRAPATSNKIKSAWYWLKSKVSNFKRNKPAKITNGQPTGSE